MRIGSGDKINNEHMIFHRELRTKHFWQHERFGTLAILTVSLLRDSDGKNTATYHMLFRIIDCVHSDTSSFFMLILHYFRFFVRKMYPGKNALSKICQIVY